MLIRPCAFACALALSIAASGEARGADDTVSRVVVAGARHDARRDETAASIVVNREELLRHGDRSLGDALKRVPGVTVGAPGARDSGIRLRGLGSGYTQILLNGVAAPAGFSFDALAPDLIERVEIVRTASAELGTQSIAGTINIVLRRAGSAASTTLKTGVDVQRGVVGGQVSGEAGATDATRAFSYAVPVALARTRVGTRLGMDERAPGIDRVSAQTELNAATQLTVSPRASWNFEGGDKLDVRTLASVHRRAIELDATETAREGGTSRYPQRGSLFESSANSVRADLLWTRKFDGGGRVDVKGGGDASRRHSDFDFSATVAGLRGPALHSVRADFSDTGYYGGTTWTAAPVAGHAVTLGWDGARARRTQGRLGRDRDVPGVDVAERDDLYHGAVDRIGVFVQDAWDINPAWSLSAGWRGEILETSVRERHGPQVRQRSVIGSPLLQLLYKPDARGQWRAGLARTYKAPTMPMLIPRRYTIDNNNSATHPDTEGNPALRPEKAWGIDAGYDWYPVKDGLLSMSGYARRIDDVTVDRLFRDGASWVTTPDNQGRALARGVALEAKLPLASDAGAPRLTVTANLARNWSRVERIAGPDNRIDEQVPLSASMGVEYRGGVRAGATLTYARGAVARMSAQWSTRSGGSRALDLYALWGSSSRLRVRLAATNLLERPNLAGARYQLDDAARETVIRTSTGPALRLTVELDLGR